MRQSQKKKKNDSCRQLYNGSYSSESGVSCSIKILWRQSFRGFPPNLKTFKFNTLTIFELEIKLNGIVTKGYLFALYRDKGPTGPILFSHDD